MGVIYVIQLPRECMRCRPPTRSAVMQRLAARYPPEAPPVMAIVQHVQPYADAQGTHVSRPGKILVLHGGGSDDSGDAGTAAGRDISANITAAIAASKAAVATLGGTDDSVWYFAQPSVLGMFVHNASLRGFDLYGRMPVRFMAQPPLNLTQPPDFDGQLGFCVRVPSYASVADYHLAVALLQCVVEELQAVTPGGCGPIPIKVVRT